MHDQPSPSEILAAATALLRSELIPALPGGLAFKARILANALDLVSRQVALGDGPGAAAQARLEALGGGDLTGLSAAIESGAVALDDATLLADLWAVTLAKLAVDQPGYASYRAEIQE
jgi:hypothetical protein